MTLIVWDGKQLTTDRLRGINDIKTSRDITDISVNKIHLLEDKNLVFDDELNMQCVAIAYAGAVYTISKFHKIAFENKHTLPINEVISNLLILDNNNFSFILIIKQLVNNEIVYKALSFINDQWQTLKLTKGIYAIGSGASLARDFTVLGLTDTRLLVKLVSCFKDSVGKGINTYTPGVDKEARVNETFTIEQRKKLGKVLTDYIAKVNILK